MSEPIRTGDIVALDYVPKIRYRVTSLKDDWASFHVVRKNGQRDMRWMPFSGLIGKFTLVERGQE